jgi:hypothetical protein
MTIYRKPAPQVDRLPDQAIRITVGKLTSTVHSEHLVPERILQLTRRHQRHRYGKGTHNPNARWTEAVVREMRELHLLQHQSICAIAARFNTHDASVSRIVRWKDWAHCDHDLRELPRPKLIGNQRPQLSPEEEARRLQAKRERQREYNRNYRNRQRTLNCATCVHWVHKCGLGYPEASRTKGTYARHCPAYATP